MNKIIPIIFILHLIMANEPIAVVSKVRGKVQHKMLGDNVYKSNTRVNSPIFLESQILTEDKAFTKVVFLNENNVKHNICQIAIRRQEMKVNMYALRRISCSSSDYPP